ncbi:MAG: hypothetical protein R3A10_03470 [Caldilineaceae bacterium]
MLTAVRHTAQQFDGVVARHDGVGRVVLHAEVLALGNGVQHLEEDVHALRELGVAPVAVLVMVLKPENNVVFPGHGQ